MAEHANTTPAPIARRRRATAAPASNIVPMPKRLTGTKAIVAEVQARSRQQEQSLLERMREVTAILQERHRERANELLPIALRMDRSMLDDFIEIGQRMLAARGRA